MCLMRRSIRNEQQKLFMGNKEGEVYEPADKAIAENPCSKRCGIGQRYGTYGVLPVYKNQQEYHD